MDRLVIWNVLNGLGLLALWVLMLSVGGWIAVEILEAVAEVLSWIG